MSRMSADPDLSPPAAEYGSGPHRFRLATGSPGELGLLRALGEAFGARADATLVWHKHGTGESLRLLEAGRVDMAMVHAPADVDAAVAAGWATGKRLIGSNEFFIVGPAHDPAGIGAAADAVDAYRRIATCGAPFISRGDHSGTHQKELQLWTASGAIPAAPWYIVTHDFMTASLRRAEAEGAYFMSDSSTWIMEQHVAPSLKVLFRGDRRLVNVYHALVAPPGRTPGGQVAAGFVAFVASPAGQAIIRTYGAERYPAPLYNDAEYARQYISDSD